jgi:hypothetical protein
MLPVVSIGENEIKGKSLDLQNCKLFHEIQEDKGLKMDEILELYEEQLKNHMIYHLTKEHRVPSIHQSKKMYPKEANQFLEDLIMKDELSFDLSKICLVLNDHWISLEILFNIYVEQIRNEFTVFENYLPQGYVYTINPPRIFAGSIGYENVSILNRIQILAFKSFVSNIKHLKCLGFDDFADKGAVFLYYNIFQNTKVEILAKKKLTSSDGRYKYKNDKNFALIIHNNSDAFGENM